MADAVENIDDIEKLCVDELRNLIKDDPELPSTFSNLGDEILYIIIRARRNRPNVSLKLVKSLHNFKTKQYPDLFADLSLKQIEPIIENEMIQVVRRKDSGYDGPAVFRTAKWNTSQASMNCLIKAAFAYATHITKMSTPEQQRQGIVMVLDMCGFGFSHARECSYSNVTKLANCIIFGSPFRIVSAFLVNSPYVFEKVWSVVKYAIPELYRNFITVTTKDFKKLHGLVDSSLLPESFGGSVPEEEAWETGLEDEICKNYSEEMVTEFFEKLGLSSDRE